MSETTRRSRGVWPVVFALLGATAVALVAVAAVVALRDDGGEPQVVEIVIPAGTDERLAAGETVVLMPAVLEFEVGDILRIRNEDDVDQTIGPYHVAAGTEFELEYGRPGTYEGYCPLSEGQSYKIVVSA